MNNDEKSAYFLGVGAGSFLSRGSNLQRGHGASFTLSCSSGSVSFAGEGSELNERVTMTYFLKPVEQDQTLFVTCEGEMRIDEVLEVHKQVKAVLTGHPLRRILVDVTRAKYVSTVIELFYFATGLSSGLPRDTRVALIVRPDQARHAKVLETVARRGGAYLTYFVDREKAEVWVQSVKRPTAISSRTQTITMQ